MADGRKAIGIDLGTTYSVSLIVKREKKYSIVLI